MCFNSKCKSNKNQCFDFYLNGPSNEIRDNYMAENLSWILDNNPNSKIVLWAHNGHISKQRGGMGNNISIKYSDQYYSIGFLTNKGKIHWRETKFYLNRKQTG